MVSRLIVLSISVLALLNCGPSDQGDGDIVVKGDDCAHATTCLFPAVCNPSTNQCDDNLDCDQHAECGNGGHCTWGGVCQQSETGSPCETDDQCLTTEMCFGVSVDSAGACGCTAESHVAEARPPNILLVVDRSGSMSGSPWTGAKTAVNSIADNFGMSSNLGLAIFPSSGTCDVAGANPAIAANNGANVKSRIASVSTTGGTPITAQFEYFANNNQFPSNGGQNAIVFMTDGGDGCSGSPASLSAAVTSLNNQGVLSFAIGYGNSASAATLDTIATAGGTVNRYDAPDGPALAMVLSTIIGNVLPCSYVVTGMPTGDVVVLVDDEVVDSGWTYDSSTGEVVFDNATCQMLRQNDNSKVEILSGCAAIPD